MAAKVIILSESNKPEKYTRVVAEYLVRQLIAVQISKYLYRRVAVRLAAEVAEQPTFPQYHAPGPSQSPRSGNLRWEPPKYLRNLKGHPWSQIFCRA